MTAQTTQRYLGCISGTSVDGLDIALVEVDTDNQVSIGSASTTAFPQALQETLLALGQPGADDLDLLGRSDAALGAFIGHALIQFMDAHDIDRGSITAVGSHGQTVRHRPPEPAHDYGFTTQIGDPNYIAEITGLMTVADFRRRDMAAGGQGAPLVPPFHQVLFGQSEQATVVLNIGGISNISILGNTPSGFDTGPGNALMDAWCALHTGHNYDQDGRWARTGKIDQHLLRALLTDPYFALPPPKSTGREYFNLKWLTPHLEQTNAGAADVQATLVAFTAECTVEAINRWAPDTQSLVVCGGGRLNSALMQALEQRCEAQVLPSEAHGIGGDDIEAALFGWLAHQRLQGLIGSEPAVTGARSGRVLGAIYPA
ncbi:MAG: anhydro-N-acetylmuramic acid kinase [Pseudomonadales bacterium]|nr:anhydro-N-acetylmuramic acid kinase [Pseudomonadales bacterium]